MAMFGGSKVFFLLGWKLPDMMIATRRSLSDACTSIAQQLENVYASIRKMRRELSSNINLVGSNLDEVASLTANTQEKVTELLGESERFGHDVRDAVETLELKISRIEGKQDLTNLGIKKLVGVAKQLDNNLLEENNQMDLLPPPSSELASPSVSSGSLEVHRPFHNSSSSTSQQKSNGLPGAGETSSNDTSCVGKTENGSSSWLPSIFRLRSATNSVLQRAGTVKQ